MKENTQKRCSTRRLAILLLVLTDVARSFAQGEAPQQDGWQGPRPASQQALPPAVLQRPSPTRPQMLEIPSDTQPMLQEIPQPQALPPSSAQTPSVRPAQLLTITVTDTQGRYVTGLREEDFTVYEEDMPQHITYFNTGQHEPVSLGFLVDMSESMLSKQRRARQAFLSFVKTIKPRDEVFLQVFNHHPLLLQDFTDSRPLLMQATAQFRPMGKTALYDAILAGLQRIQHGRNGKKALIVISDGLDTASRASLKETLSAIRRSGILVYTIGIGSLNRDARRVRWGRSTGPFSRGRVALTVDTVDTRLLETVSQETGAKHFLLDTSEVLGSGAALDRATQTIAYELRQQYSIGYHSPLKGDVYRDVRVETLREGLIVRAQQGSS